MHRTEETTYKEVGVLVGLLKACAKSKDLHRCFLLHADILQKGLLQKISQVGNALIDAYGKCGAIAKAQEMFDELQIRNIVSWNVLIAAYTQNGCSEDALKCFDCLHLEKFKPDAITFVCVLKSCASIGAVDKAKEIHLEILREDLLVKNALVGTALVDMYAKCGQIKIAQEIFNGLQVRDVVSWNVFIAGLVQRRHDMEAFHYFEQMQIEGFFGYDVTIICILKACSSIGAFDKGKQIHAKILGDRFLAESIMVGNALIDMYAKCGALDKAQQVFNELHVRDIVSWNSLIAGYSHHEQGDKALDCFERMQCDGFSPDAITFACALKACGSTKALDKGIEIHAEVVSEGLHKEDLLICNVLIEMYAKCGTLKRAQQVFDELPAQSVVSWNVLIGGHIQQGHFEEVLKCFRVMQSKGFCPNVATCVYILRACASIGAADNGEDIHTEIIRESLMEQDIAVGNAVVDMYAKCGAIEKAQDVFDKLYARDVVSWTSLIAGYAHLGMDDIAMNLVNKMVEEGVKPSSITFTVVLNTCSHSGLWGTAQAYFQVMTEEYGIIPTLEHYSCMVDLFSRVGRLDKVLSLILRVPSSDYLPLWTAMLGTSQKCGDLKLGKLAFEYALQLDVKDVVPYVCMSNIYAAAAMTDDAD